MIILCLSQSSSSQYLYSKKYIYFDLLYQKYPCYTDWNSYKPAKDYTGYSRISQLSVYYFVILLHFGLTLLSFIPYVAYADSKSRVTITSHCIAFLIRLINTSKAIASYNQHSPTYSLIGKLLQQKVQRQFHIFYQFIHLLALNIQSNNSNSIILTKMESATHTMKIIVVGNSGVGKTSLIKRYIEGDIPRAHIATLGMELESKTMKFPKGNIKLHIWDTVLYPQITHTKAGQEQYQSLTKSYFAGSSLAIIVFDVTDPTSYREIFKWLEIIQNNTIHEIQIFLAGNKADLDSGQ
eukprot:TRINITY_DN826_c0_g4_i1.p1 TRINITY_DN826_c0_g4~~TRINITY_DN826_c0_g4_i1.p1  ORF type:complete len:334 (-),score=-21.25 TRINITY_DN826_c0_g4_i1:416-1300(-)